MNIDDYNALKEAEAKIPEDVKPEEATKKEEPAKSSPEKVKIGDEEVTLEELTKGYLRQSDYTKKTTEISQLRKEHAEAIKLFDLVQNNPTLQDKLKEAGGNRAVIDSANKESKRIRDLETKIASMELDSMVTSLKSKYSDFDETKVINEAAKRGSTDLEFIYKATREAKVDKSIDKAALKAELLAEIQAEMGGTIPPTLMSGKASAKPVTTKTGPTMSAQEHSIAEGMGMTDADYIKYRDA